MAGAGRGQWQQEDSLVFLKIFYFEIILNLEKNFKNSRSALKYPSVGLSSC